MASKNNKINAVWYGLGNEMSGLQCTTDFLTSSNVFGRTFVDIGDSMEKQSKNLDTEEIILGSVKYNNVTNFNSCDNIEEEIPFKDSRKERDSSSYDNVKNYYLYYVTNSSNRKVTKATFSKIRGRILTFENNYIKIMNFSENNKNHVSFNKIKTSLNKNFKTQGMFDLYKQMKDFLSLVTNWITTINEIAALHTILKDSDFYFTLIDAIISIVFIVQSQTVNWSSITVILYNLYKVFHKYQVVFKTEGLENVMLGIGSMFMPKQIYTLFQRIQTFTNSKIGDDISLAYSFFSSVMDYVTSLLDYIPGFSRFREQHENLFSFLKLPKTYDLVKKSKKFLEDFDKNNKIILNETFRAAFKELYEEVNKNESLLEWSRRSTGISSLLSEMLKLNRVVSSYESASRREPSCFVFEGPPGCMKSVMMNAVIKSLNKSAYAHAIKAMMDGKDWYDSYNNEEVFYMDDVGQQGNSQWRTIINMVSPVKLPLDCAEAKLKDTKFFNSDIILCTTNRFTEINGLKENDCISDITALWRRAYVFKFETVRNLNILEGQIKFIHYDVNDKCFSNDFPLDIRTFIKNKKINIKPYFVIDNTNPDILLEMIAWMKDLVNIANVVKIQQYEENSSFDFNKINSLSKFFVQGNIITNARNHPYRTGHASQVVEFEDAQTDFYGIDLSVLTFNIANREFLFAYKHIKTDTFFDFISCVFTDSIKGIFNFIITAPSRFISWLDSLSETEICIILVCFILTEIIVLIANLYALNSVSNELKNLDEEDRDELRKVLREDGESTFSLLKKKKEGYNFVSKNNCQHKTKFKAQTENLHPSVSFIKKQVKNVIVHCSKADIKSCALLSGHYVILPAHMAPEDECYLTAFNTSEEDNHRLLDHIKVSRFYYNVENDLAILKLPNTYPTPFKSLVKHFHVDLAFNSIAKRNYLISTDGCIPLETIRSEYSNDIFYDTNSASYKYENKVSKTDVVYYHYQRPALCGSVIYDIDCGILGIHVAGDENQNLGASILLSKETKKIIIETLVNDVKFFVKQEISDKPLINFSGIKLAENFHSSSPKDSNIVPTELFGIFPVTRHPAELSKFGPHTVKDVAKKSFDVVSNVDFTEVKFAASVLDSIIPSFEDLTEEEVVAGNDLLAGMNKDSSNGKFCAKEKDYYINFKEKKFTSIFKLELDHIIEEINSGTVNIRDYVWTESLKDELRSDSKMGIPRSFRISRIHIQVLTKMCFGQMIEKLIRTKEFHGIMVGMNPFRDWPSLYNKFSKCEIVWDLDFKNWDGKMLPQVQTCLNEVILANYKGKYPLVAEFILTTLLYTPISINDDVFLSTHSMPSGSFLTAYYNSLVNKALRAMWAYRYGVYNVQDFFKYIEDIVYGDDVVTGIKEINKVTKNLDAVTMAAFTESIGMECTDGNKNKIIEKSIPMKDITFLKRKFRYHSKLGDVTCPLDTNTLMSGLSFYNRDKVAGDVLRDKIHCFQREIFLHEHLYEECVEKLEKTCQERNVPFQRLPEKYIINLYKDSPDQFLELAWGGSKYA